MLFAVFMNGTVYASIDTAESACVINSVTGEVVYEKNAYVKRPMASTTKIMTLITALEKSKPEDMLTVGSSATSEEGSSAYLKPGAKISMGDISYGLMLNSGNDAAVAIAEHISGDTEKFAKLMNDNAKKIGAKDTHFVNPNGLHNDNHYTTAYDLAKITRYAMKNEQFRKIVSYRNYTGTMMFDDGTSECVEYINHNRLLGELDGCIGVKTGYTNAAGRCLVSAVERGGAEYIIVTLSDSDDWNTHKELCEKAFGTQKKKIAVKKGDCVKHAVYEKSECPLVAKNDFSVYCHNEKCALEIIRHIPEKIDFPVNGGEKVGYLKIKYGDETIGTVDVVAECDFKPHGNVKVKNCFVFTLINLVRNIF